MVYNGVSVMGLNILLFFLIRYTCICCIDNVFGRSCLCDLESCAMMPGSLSAQKNLLVLFLRSCGESFLSHSLLLLRLHKSFVFIWLSITKSLNDESVVDDETG